MSTDQDCQPFVRNFQIEIPQHRPDDKGIQLNQVEHFWFIFLYFFFHFLFVSAKSHREKFRQSVAGSLAPSVVSYNGQLLSARYELSEESLSTL